LVLGIVDFADRTALRRTGRVRPELKHHEGRVAIAPSTPAIGTASPSRAGATRQAGILRDPPGTAVDLERDR
jgi:hypothetical protein